MEKVEEGNSSLSKPPAFYASLIQAILDDDWKTAEDFIMKNPNCRGAAITDDKDTALTFATGLKRIYFVKELVKLMTKEEVELTTNGCTALYFAAQTEIVQIAKAMVEKNNQLPMIFPKNVENGILYLPLYAAIQTGNREMVTYLYSQTNIQKLDSVNGIKLLNVAISHDLYDTAHKIMDTLKLEEKELIWSPLELLARKPSEIGKKSQPSIWERCLNSC